MNVILIGCNVFGHIVILLWDKCRFCFPHYCNVQTPSLYIFSKNMKDILLVLYNCQTTLNLISSKDLKKCLETTFLNNQTRLLHTLTQRLA